MAVQLVPMNKKDKLELKGFIKLNKEIYGPDAGATTDYWRDSIPFWIVVDNVPCGTTAAWKDVRYTDGEDFEPDKPGWLYIGDLGLQRGFELAATREAVIKHWVKYAREHRFKAISTNEPESDPLFQLYVEAGFKEVGSDTSDNPNNPQIILELRLPK
jgi:hypothetical protein